MSKKNKILIIVIGILLFLFLNFFQKEIRNFFYKISEPIQRVLWGAGDRVSGFFETITKINKLKKEADELKLKNQELLAKIAFLEELKKENEILREALNIELQKEFTLSFAQVLGKDSIKDSILIDKGSKDGISEGFPVITQSRVLLGKISEVYQNFSKVSLISDKENSFDAKIQESEIYGVIKGKGSLKVFLDLIPQDKEIREGDLVVTTSLGGIFPPGILVGQIGKVGKSDILPFQEAEISPMFSLNEVEKVFVILEY
ncbi:rod shape-determining protein MreC [Patescibacteria group bacterium]|nr:rod shape-determining protein MreC [Patescibacteria group bacterium]